MSSNAGELPPSLPPSSTHTHTHLDRLSPQNQKVLGPLRQEPRKLVHQDMLNLIRLLDLDADADGVDARLDEDPFVLVPGHRERVQQHLRRLPGLDLGHIMAFGRLRGEVAQRDCGGQGRPHTLEVWPQRLGLCEKAVFISCRLALGGERSGAYHCDEELAEGML